MRPLTSATATCWRATAGQLLESPAWPLLRQCPAFLPRVVPTHANHATALRLVSARLKGKAFHFQPSGCEKAFVTVLLEAFSEHVARPGTLAAACPSISRRQLLHQSVVAAYVLRACGVARGDRLILLMPHCIEQMVWMLAAKRIGALYVSMSVNISLKVRRARSLLHRFSSFALSPRVTSTLALRLIPETPSPNLRPPRSWTRVSPSPPCPPLAFTPRPMPCGTTFTKPLALARQTSAHHPRR